MARYPTENATQSVELDTRVSGFGVSGQFIGQYYRVLCAKIKTRHTDDLRSTDRFASDQFRN